MVNTESSIAAAYKRANQTFLLQWRGTGQSRLYTGWPAAAAALGISAATLRVYLSNGKAAQGWTRTNPVTNEPDILTCLRGPTPVAPKKAKPKKPRGKVGRPRREER